MRLRGATWGGLLPPCRACTWVPQDVQRKVMDIASTLGISRNLMNIIHRRGTLDKYLVYIGMAVIVTLVVLLRHYL